MREQNKQMNMGRKLLCSLFIGVGIEGGFCVIYIFINCCLNLKLNKTITFKYLKLKESLNYFLLCQFQIKIENTLFDLIHPCSIFELEGQ